MTILYRRRPKSALGKSSSCASRSERRRLRLGSHLGSSPTSCCSVREALAFGADQGPGGAGRVVNAECNARIVAKIELGKVAMQVLFLAVLVSAAHASLKNAEVA